MPFLEGAGPSGQIGSGLPKATLVVQPDKILELKRRLEDRRVEIHKFVTAERDNLTKVPPPGADPCSLRAAAGLSHNGKQAVEAVAGFTAELTNIIDALDESARLYGLVEDTSTDRFRRVPE